MATSTDMLDAIRIEIGDVTPADGSDPTYSDATLLDTYFPAGLEMLKGNWPQLYSVDSTTRVISPDPSDSDYNDERALVVAASMCVMRAELTDARRKSIYHSDPAGATDLRDRADALKQAIADLVTELNDLRFHKTRRLVEEEVDQGIEISRSDIAHQGG